MSNPINPKEVPSPSFHNMLPIFSWIREEVRTHLSHERGRFFQYVPLIEHIHERFPDLYKRHQALLSYYLPFQNIILKSPALQKACIQSCINVVVDLKERTIQEVPVSARTINHTSYINHMLLGGIEKKVCRHIEVHVGPIPIDQIEDFIEGGTRRILLQEALLPSFLPQESTSSIFLSVDKAYKKLRIAEDNISCRLGINSYV